MLLDFTGNEGFKFKNYVYSGSTGVDISGFATIPLSYGSKYSLKESSFKSDQYILTGSGDFYSKIFETCHGVNYGNTNIDREIGKTGEYNFYMAPYGPGYYQPPFGELPTIVCDIEDPPSALGKTKYELTQLEHLKLFGLRLSLYQRTFLSCKSRPPAFVHEGNSDCPIVMSSHSKYNSHGVELCAGTFLGGIGGNIYNHNPIPCSYDRGFISLGDGPYQRVLKTINNPNGPPVTICEDTCTPRYRGFRPENIQLPNNSPITINAGHQYDFSSTDRLGAEGVDQVHETASLGFSHQRGGTDAQVTDNDILNFGLGNYWHFIFENNHKTLPFGNTTENVDMISAGALAERHWWEHREGREDIDYLNHAFGNNINACPMNYLDIPYYAAIGKFGYFGTRFQDTWRVQTGDIYSTGPTTYPSRKDCWVQGASMKNGQADSCARKPGAKFAELKIAQRGLTNFSGVLIETQQDHLLTPADLKKTVRIRDLDKPYMNGDYPIETIDSPNRFSYFIPIHATFTSRISGANGLIAIDCAGPHFLEIGETVRTNSIINSSAINGFTDVDDKLIGTIESETSFTFGKPATTNRIIQYQNSAVIIKTVPLGDPFLLSPAAPDKRYGKANVQDGPTYDEILSKAAIERKHYDFSSNDRVLFLKLNIGVIIGQQATEYQNLTLPGSTTEIKNFAALFTGLCSTESHINENTIGGNDRTDANGDPLPEVSGLTPGNQFKILNAFRDSSLIPTENPIERFYSDYVNTGCCGVPGVPNTDNCTIFNELIRKYGSYKVLNVGSSASSPAIDFEFYDKMMNEKKIRMANNYYKSIVNGYPVDLFPNGTVTFSFERALDFAKSNFIKHAPFQGISASAQSTYDALRSKERYSSDNVNYAKNPRDLNVPSVPRRYFHGSFSNLRILSGFNESIGDPYKIPQNTLAGQSLGDPAASQPANHATESSDTHGSRWPVFNGPIYSTYYGVVPGGKSVSGFLKESSGNFYEGYVRAEGCGSDTHVPASDIQLELINLPKTPPWDIFAPETGPSAKDPLAALPANQINSPRRSGWLSPGYNEVGRYTKNFSCFSPIFLQQPLNESVKMCQAPKFRVYAVDYHTIPEDKIKENKRNGANALPEIAYWLKKMKVIDSFGDNLYPLTYKWFRVHKSLAEVYYKTKNIPATDANGAPIPSSYFQPASVSGEWCCAEGENTSDCSPIIPKECINMWGVEYNGLNANQAAPAWPATALFWPKKSVIEPIGSSRAGEYRIPEAIRMMGASRDYGQQDKDYYYFCRVQGRFGWRDSEFAKVNIEKTLELEFSTMDANGMGFSPDLIVKSHYGSEINIGPVRVKPGMIHDASVTASQTVTKKWLSTRNCIYQQFVGRHGYRGVLRVQSPSTFIDMEGTRRLEKHWVDFGELSRMSVSLDQPLATALYADKALPHIKENMNPNPLREDVLDINGNYSLGNIIHFRYKGVSIRLTGVVHRTALKAAGMKLYNEVRVGLSSIGVTVGAYDYGLKPNKINSVAGLYGHVSSWNDSRLQDGKLEFYLSPMTSHGHAQFDVNLGALKKYSTMNLNWVNYGDTYGYHNIQFITPNITRHGPRNYNINLAVTDFVMGKPYRATIGHHLAGTELSEFTQLPPDGKRKLYSISGPENGYVDATIGRLMLYYVETYKTFYNRCEAKKTLRQDDYICGGLRLGRPGINVNWLGRPNDTRLKRVSMPGPYAFQWKVARHNRDRNGNGMSLGFWSYDHEKRMDNLYDAPAVFGALKRVKPGVVLPQDIFRSISKYKNARIPEDPDNGAFQDVRSRCGTRGLRWTTIPLTVDPDGNWTNGYWVIPDVPFNNMMNSLPSVDGPEMYGCPSINDPTCFHPCVSLKYTNGFHPRGGKNLSYSNGTKTVRINTSILSPAGAAPLNPTAPVLGIAPNPTPFESILSVNLSACSTNRRDICNYITPTIHMGIDTFAVARVSSLSPIFSNAW